MAIYVTGDTHGGQPHGYFSYDCFMRRFNTSSFPEQKEMGKEDYVIICGDFGGVWDVDRIKVQESPEERNALDWLEDRPFMTVFVPGNHENYDRLTGCVDERRMNSWFYEKMPEAEKEKLKQGYPRETWHGGSVRVLRPSVRMLERGDIFDLGGRSCFAFGGARSHDIRDGILDPADYPNEESFRKAYAWRKYGMIRVAGLSWWAQEMPSDEEMAHGRAVVADFLAHHERIDFVFTHDAPQSDRILLGFPEGDELTGYLEEMRTQMRYGKWFYGHLHDNRRVTENSYLLYEQIIRIA